MVQNQHEARPSFLRRLSRKFYIYLSLFIFIVLGISFFRTLSNISAVNRKIADKELEVQRKRNEEAELEKKLEFSKSSEFMDKQLRDKLGLVKEGEIVVVMPPQEVLRQFAPKYQDELQAPPDPNWKKWINLFR